MVARWWAEVCLEKCLGHQLLGPSGKDSVLSWGVPGLPEDRAQAHDGQREAGEARGGRHCAESRLRVRAFAPGVAWLDCSLLSVEV